MSKQQQKQQKFEQSSNCHSAQDVIVSDELKQIINGYVMGDGYLSPQGSLTVDHSVDQEKFVVWMLDKLKPFCTPDRKITPTTRMRNGVETYSRRFNTKTLFKNYRAIWYPQGKKRLPVDIETMFTPLFIAVWFACDGTKVLDARGAKFEVTAFTPDERGILKNLFLSKYDINPGIIRQGESRSGKTQWALVIYSQDYTKFHDIITRDTDLIQTLFPYKLHPRDF